MLDLLKGRMDEVCCHYIYPSTIFLCVICVFYHTQEYFTSVMDELNNADNVQIASIEQASMSET